MLHLSLALLGSFQATLDGQLVSGWKSNKIKGLLAYLAAEADQPHPREMLAGLLWPNYSNSSALNNLRDALSALRQAIGDRQAEPPFLLVTRETIQFNLESDHDLDVATFTQHLADSELVSQRNGESAMCHLQAAINLYRGSFLEGFSCDSAPFEEWVLVKQEQLNQRMLAALYCLAEHYEQGGDYERANAYARRQLALEPWYEEAHQQLMRGLALNGQRSTALSQYEICCRALMQELGVEPSQETTELYQSIRDGTLDKSIAAIHLYPPVSFAQEDPPAPGEPPFKGLCYFDEVDADLFFGREALTARLVRRVCEFLSPAPGEGSGGRFLAVVGASGSGKSSLVRAGLVPALKRSEPLADGALAPEGRTSSSHVPFRGPIHVITPTAHPLEALAVSLTREAESVTATATLMDDLARDPRSLHLSVLKRLSGDAHHCLLVVDQFEELFSLCRSDAERKAFVDNLLFAAGSLPLPSGGRVEDEGGPTLVVVTLRADFYAHCAPFDPLRQALCQGQEYIGSMGVEEMRRAIEEPARRGGWTFESGLVDLLLREAGAGEEPGALPLLSHALLETWQRRRGHTLTFAGYAESGGVHGAIAKTAETVYQKLAPRQRTITRNIFLRLTELGEGTQDTRRRAALMELVSRPEDTAAVQAVLKKLADARLITMAEETAEVAHEALIREWATLREWLSENREGLRLHRHLTQAAQEWDKLNRDADALYRGARLAQALEWADAHADDLNVPERAFLDASLAERQKREDEEAARQRRELETARKLAETEKRRAEEQTRAAGQLRQRAMGLAGALVIAAILAIVAFIASQRATQSAATAQAEARTRATAEASAVQERQNALLQAAILLAQQAENEVQYGNPDRAVLLALEALVNYPDTAQAEHALGQAVTLGRAERFLAGHTSTVGGVAWSPNGKQVATASTDGTVRIWDAAAGKEVRRLQVNNQAYSVAWSPDGNTLLYTTGDRFLYVRGDQGVDVFVWDVRQSAPITLYTAPTYTLFIEGVSNGIAEKIQMAENTSHSAAFSPDGQRLAFITDQTVTVWDLAQSKAVLELAGHTDLVYSVAWSPNGRRLLTAGEDQTARIWDAADGRLLQTLRGGHTQAVTAAVFSPDGVRAATSAQDGVTVVWDATTGQKLLQMTVDAKRVWDVTWSPDGKRLATANESGVVQMWDTATGQATFALRGHDGRVVSVAWSADGQHLLSGSKDSTAYIWKATSGTEAFALEDPSGSTSGVDWTPDGHRILTVGGTWLEMGVMDGVVRDWDVETGKQLRALEPVYDFLLQVAFSPDGQYFLTRQELGTPDKDFVLVWDYAQGKIVNAIPVVSRENGGFVRDAAWAPDGKRIAAVTNTGLAKVYDAFTGQELVSFTGHPTGKFIVDVIWSPDGKWIGTAGFADDPWVRIWDAQTGQERLKLEHQDSANSAAWSPAGDRICTSAGGVESGGTDNVIRLWDAKTGQLQQVIYGHTAAVWRCGWSPDGRRVFSASQDGTTRIWDAATGAELLRLPTPTIWYEDAFWSPTGKYLATIGDEQPTRLWRVWQSTQELVDYARQCCVVRNLTAKEREQFGLP